MHFKLKQLCNNKGSEDDNYVLAPNDGMKFKNQYGFL